MNYKNIILLALLAFGFSSVSFSQQNAVMTHYTLNPYLYNPAQVGNDNFLKANVHYRKQWVEMPDAPDTKVITFQTKLKNKFGIGGKIYMDKVHIVESIGAKLSYAYYVNFNKNTTDHYLSFGLSAGFKQQRLRFDEASIADELDPSIFYNGTSKIRFDADAGVSYFYKGLELGFSVANITPLSINYNSNNQELNYKTIYHLYGNVGYNVKLGSNKDLTLKPSVFVRYVPNNIPFQFDANLLFDYKNIFWLGAGYRFEQNGIWGTVGARVHDMVALSYSIEAGAIQDFKNLGTIHEFTVEVRFKNKKKDKKIKDLFNENELIKDSLTTLKNTTDSLSVDNKIKDEALKAFEAKLDSLQKTNTPEDEINNFIDISYTSFGVVKFAKSTYTLSEQEIATLKNIANEIKKEKPEDILLIQLVGSASIEGSENYNLILSNKRSESVKQILVEEGVDASLISTSAKGNTVALLRKKLEIKDSDNPIKEEDRIVNIQVLKR